MIPNREHITEQSLLKQLTQHKIKKSIFDHIWQFTAISCDTEHKPRTADGKYCNGCVYETIHVIRYVRGEEK